MNWIKKGDYIYDENMDIVAILPTNYDETHANVIVSAPKMLEAMIEYIERIESGSQPTKKSFDKFKAIVSRILEAA